MNNLMQKFMITLSTASTEELEPLKVIIPSVCILIIIVIIIIISANRHNSSDDNK